MKNDDISTLIKNNWEYSDSIIYDHNLILLILLLLMLDFYIVLFDNSIADIPYFIESAYRNSEKCSKDNLN